MAIFLSVHQDQRPTKIRGSVLIANEVAKNFLRNFSLRNYPDNMFIFKFLANFVNARSSLFDF